MVTVTSKPNKPLFLEQKGGYITCFHIKLAIIKDNKPKPNKGRVTKNYKCDATAAFGKFAYI